MRVLFAKHNNQRLPQFQILTKICIDKNGKTVVKEALNPKAQEHIDRICDNYAMLKEATSIQMPEPLKVQNSLHFRFIECGSFEEELIKLHKKNDTNALDSLIFEYIEFINGLSDKKETLFLPCHRFVSVFGELDIKEPLDLVSLANIDLIFSNLFYEDKKFIVSDYEWVFDFAIPKDYIIARALANFSKNHPIDIQKYLPSFEKYEKEFYKMEDNFHRFVFGENNDYSLNYDIQKKNIDIIAEYRKLLESPPKAEPLHPLEEKSTLKNFFCRLFS